MRRSGSHAPRGRLETTAIICGLVLALTACGGGGTPTPETPTSTSPDTPSTSDRSPATVTETSTVTEAPPSPEPTDSTTDSATSTSSASDPTAEAVDDEVEPLESEQDQDSDEWSTPSAAETEATETEDFDAAWAQECADRVVEDMEIVDERLLDGISVSRGLDLLSDSFGCFEEAGVPPGSDEAEYLSLVLTLSDFSWDAADLYWDDPMTATAKYQVVKENTESLFATINAATGSDYRVP